jgi:hypothetical protein
MVGAEADLLPLNSYNGAFTANIIPTLATDTWMGECLFHRKKLRSTADRKGHPAKNNHRKMAAPALARAFNG